MVKLRRRTVFLAAVLTATAIGSGLWVERQLRIDACLDGGGRWDYGGGICVKT